ncbi:response regulator transcription factor [Bacteroides sp. 51]|uniref:response regulator transcription factor n=1 Tax=Bacteroides sp. 51 TaxID=2302938 RepID=UPI0013D58690|nr:response regulator transcription factor [Bacteroides sp. 51]NDV82089.1 DNA-binding response regulator [Bacteroides sp. 51]
MIRLLVVEDDENLRYNIKDGLEITVGGYDVILAVNGKEGLEFWKEERPDIILADVDMPKMNGFEMVEYIRERDQEIPILFISGCKSSRDITTGYDLGANNYIKKPFSAHEIDAHIKALLKMRNETRRKNQSNLQKIGNFTLDAPNSTLRFEAIKTISLTHREAQILQELCLSKGEVVKRTYLLEKYWDIPGGEDFFASRSLDVMISKLRSKLKDDPKVKIQVIKGMGIILVDPTIPKVK